jgi:hypothetical protein
MKNKKTTRLCRHTLVTSPARVCNVLLPLMKLFLAALLFLIPTFSRATETNAVLFSENFARGVSNRWQQVKFGTPTDYRVVQDGTNFFLQAIADKSCSAFSVKLNIKPPEKLILRWRWKIDYAPTNGSERVTKRFDHAARVFVAFDTFIGPPRSLDYIWANEETVGTILPHPLSGRTQLLVVESGNARAGEWISEERDVTADWKSCFGQKAMPKIIGIGVLTDGDSLGCKLVADYADIELVSE